MHTGATEYIIMATNSIVSINGLNKWYGEFHVLRDINLDVAKGRAHRDLRPVRLG